MGELFKPVNAWCYQKALALPAIDEIELEQDRVTLVITEPHSGGGLRQEVRDFYRDVTWKNRVAFLSGPKNTYDVLIDTGKRLKAIQHILNELISSKTPVSDPQMVQAGELADRIRGNFQAAVPAQSDVNRMVGSFRNAWSARAQDGRPKASFSSSLRVTRRPSLGLIPSAAAPRNRQPRSMG